MKKTGSKSGEQPPQRSKKKHASGASNAADYRPAGELAQSLAALRTHTAEILARKRQLSQLNRWFDVALNNMGRGLSMFDAEQRLIVCNKLYRELYGLPDRLARAGTPLASIVRYHVDRVAEHPAFAADRLQQPPSQPLGFGSCRGTELYHGKFVAAKTRDEVVLTHSADQACGNAFQQGIADGMAQLIVDLLEAVEINPVQGKARVSVEVPERVIQFVGEINAVRNLRQRIVMRQPRDFLLCLTPLGNVLLDINPTAALQRLIGDLQDAATL